VKGFEYSGAMRQSGITWNTETLDAFLASPTKRVPGTAMGFDGVKDAGERRDLIAFLVAANKDKLVCP
jgi:cytochrome c